MYINTHLHMYISTHTHTYTHTHKHKHTHAHTHTHTHTNTHIYTYIHKSGADLTALAKEAAAIAVNRIFKTFLGPEAAAAAAAENSAGETIQKIRSIDSYKHTHTLRHARVAADGSAGVDMKINQ